MVMLMFCPQCKGSFEGVLQCPKCGVRLLFPTDKTRKEGEAARGEKWHQSSFGRIAVGLVLGMGLSYGLLLLTSVMLRNRGDVLAPSAGAGVFLGLQALALLAGGMLAGAGQRSGVGSGACVGVVCGVVAFGGMCTGQMAGLAEPFARADLSKLPDLQPMTPIAAMVYGLPIIDALFGVLGGLLGVMIWKPLPKLNLPASIPVEQKPVLGTQINLPPIGDKKALIPWAGPIAWIRVLIGMVVAVAGAVWTKHLLGFLMEFGGLDKGDIAKVQENVAHGELIALSVLFGGCIAGSTTPNGVKQGVLVGIGAGIGLVGYFVASGEGAQLEKLLGPLLMSAFLGPLGGWFGSELMPPATRSPRASRKKRGWL
jgi:hypothetical protein